MNYLMYFYLSAHGTVWRPIWSPFFFQQREIVFLVQTIVNITKPCYFFPMLDCLPSLPLYTSSLQIPAPAVRLSQLLLTTELCLELPRPLLLSAPVELTKLT